MTDIQKAIETITSNHPSKFRKCLERFCQDVVKFGHPFLDERTGFDENSGAFRTEPVIIFRNDSNHMYWWVDYTDNGIIFRRGQYVYSHGILNQYEFTPKEWVNRHTPRRKRKQKG